MIRVPDAYGSGYGGGTGAARETAPPSSFEKGQGLRAFGTALPFLAGPLLRENGGNDDMKLVKTEDAGGPCPGATT